MLRSIEIIRSNFSSLGYEPDTPEWAALWCEWQETTKFWAAVRGLQSRSCRQDDVRKYGERIKKYFEVERLSFSDYFFIQTVLPKYVEMSDHLSEIDEGVRLLGDFLQAETGIFHPRDINDTPTYLEIECHLPSDNAMDDDNSEIFDSNFNDIDISQTRLNLWYEKILERLEDDAWLAARFPKVPVSSLENMKKCIVQYSSKRYEISYGLNESIVRLMEFVKTRTETRLRIEYSSKEYSAELSETS